MPKGYAFAIGGCYFGDKKSGRDIGVLYLDRPILIDEGMMIDKQASREESQNISFYGYPLDPDEGRFGYVHSNLSTSDWTNENFIVNARTCQGQSGGPAYIGQLPADLKISGVLASTNCGGPNNCASTFSRFTDDIHQWITKNTKKI